MGQVDATIDMTGELSARVTRANGLVEDLGVISSGPVTLPFIPRFMPRKEVRLVSRFWFLFICLSVGAVLGIAAYLLFRHFWPALLFLPLIVTNAGAAYMASDFAGGGSSPHIGAFNFQDSGTGSTAAATTDTALQTPTGGARVSGTQSSPSSQVYRSVATIPYTSGFAVTEWGLFSAAASGTLWDRRVFSAINVVNGDSIQFTYNLTCNSGGT